MAPHHRLLPHVLAASVLCASAASGRPLERDLLLAAADDGTVAAVTGGARITIAVPGKEPVSHAAPAGGSVDWPAAASHGRDVAIAWVAGDGSSSHVVLATGRDGVLSAPRIVSPAAARHARFPSIALGAGGEAWIAYVEGTGAGDDIVAVHVEGDAIAAPLRVSVRDGSEDLVPQIARDATGAVMVVWAGYDGHDDEILWSRLDGGSFTPEARVHPDNPFPDVTPSLAHGGDGRLHAAWSGFDGTSYQVSWSAWDGKSWTPPVRVSPGEGAATLPRVTSGPGGALVLWNQYDGKSSRVGASRIGARGASPLAEGAGVPLSFKPAAIPDQGSWRVLAPGAEAGSWTATALAPAR